MVNDKLRLVDGFRGLPGGMDGSQDPVLTPETAVYYAENVVFRGGAGPRTRPGFHYVNVNGSGGAGQTLDFFIQLTTGSSDFLCTETGDLIVGFSKSIAANPPYTSINGGAGYLTTASTVQCATIFNPPNREPVLVFVADGRVIAVDIVSKLATWVNTNQNNATVADFTNKTEPCYACQVEEFLVIQDGVSTPRVLTFTDSTTMRLNLATYYSTTTPIPVGRQMAYGHGRLFVTNANGREITAGDIAFGGSLTSKDIVSSSDDDKVVITTATAHGWAVGDYITITGHSSLPAINGTFKIESVPASNKFTIAAAVGVPGSGGQATKFNAGTSKDALNFSENTVINEGGSFVIPLEMGAVKTMEFLPIQDISTGQGDLIVFSERGAATFAVSAPRTQWKETVGFQRVLFSNIGALAETTCTINGDIFFRSREGNGIRSYRNARAEFSSFGQTPISAEMDPVFDKEDITKLSRVSMIHFDDRLLMTCKPDTVDGRLIYRGITAMDFRPVSTNGGKGYAIYDGVWSGVQIVSLVTGIFNGTPRAFALCYHGNHELWEITRDEKQDMNSYAGNEYRLIRSLVLTRAYDFRAPHSEKKLIHGDLWFSEVGGWSQANKKFEATLKFRPDNNPNWASWGDWELCFSEDDPNDPSDDPRALRGYAPQLRAEVPEDTTNAFTDRKIGRGYDFKMRIEWRGRAKLEKFLAHSLQLVEAVGAGAQDNTSDCILVLPDEVDETLEKIYKAWEPDGQILDFFIQLTTGSSDFLCTETGDLIVGYQKVI
jgi:hypothetical protein